MTTDLQLDTDAIRSTDRPNIIFVTRDLGVGGRSFADRIATRYFAQDRAFGEGRSDQALAMNKQRLAIMQELALPMSRDGIGRTGNRVVDGNSPAGRKLAMGSFFADLRAEGYTLSNAVVIARAKVAKPEGAQETDEANPTGEITYHARAVYISPAMAKRLAASADPTAQLLAIEDRLLREKVESFFKEVTLPAVNCQMNHDGTASVFAPYMHGDVNAKAKGRVRFRNGLLESEAFAT